MDWDRKHRENEFHDRRFSSEAEPRRHLDAVYRLMLPANVKFHQVLESLGRCGRVLEYGCGRGENALTFARRGVAITGIDLSARGVEQARAQAARAGLDVSFEVMDAENLTFADNSFEAVVGKGILHHLDIDRAYAEIARVLVPAGRAVFVEPLGHNPAINWYRRRTPGERTPDERPLRAIDLEKAGKHFEAVDLTFFNLTTLCALVLRSDAAFAAALAGCGRLDAWLFKTFPGVCKLAWMVFMDLSRPIKGA